MGTNAASVLSKGFTLPEDERARVAAERFASLESRESEYSPDQALVWARALEDRIERFATGESEGVDLAAARRRVDAALASE